MLCSRAETEQLAGNFDAAAKALAGAGEIASEIESGEDSEPGLALARVRNLAGRDRGADA